MIYPYQYPHELAIVAILKNEGDYIAEWLDYHAAAGVTKFYLYDNDSNDNIRDILRPYIERGLVEYTPWSGHCVQIPAYNDALQKHKFTCRYMAFIDIDEFLYPVIKKDLPCTLNQIFAKNPQAGGLAVNWRVFGSSGQEHKDLSQGVLDRFKHRGRYDFAHNFLVKAIVNPRQTEIFLNPHSAICYIGRPYVNELGTRLPGSEIHPLALQTLVVNHYLTKSKEEFMDKCKRGRAYMQGNRLTDEFDKLDVNEIADEEIVKFRDELPAPNPIVYEESIEPIVNAIVHLAKFPPKTEELSGKVDDLLAYLCFCGEELPKLTGEQNDYLVKSILDILERAFWVNQEIWQCQLFLSTAFRIFPFDEERVAKLVQKVAAPVQTVFLQNELWRYYEETAALRRWCQYAAQKKS